MWALKVYATTSGKCDSREEYERGSDDLRAAFDVQMEYLCEQPRQEWRRPKAAMLSKTSGFKEYFEIRIFADRVQQRPIGYFGPNSGEFTVLLWAIEKGGGFVPKEWHRKADHRREAIEDGSAISKCW